jgi:hypothetical protein
VTDWLFFSPPDLFITYEWLIFVNTDMPLGPRYDLRSLVSASDDDDDGNGNHPSVAADQGAETSPDRLLSRRHFLTGATAAATVDLAGCTAQRPGNAASVDSSTKRDGNTLIWNYPASAVQSNGRHEGIGYAAIRLRALNTAVDAGSVAPVLDFRLNSTVADIASGEPYQGYQADWFQFHIGLPRTYDGLSGLQAFVQPPQWPEVQTTYGYEGAMRELIVKAPSVNEEGTITVDGRFRPSGTTLPRQLRCQFEVQASQSGLFGRTVLADGSATFDVSELDLPAGVTVE